jgi:hypothetical protein
MKYPAGRPNEPSKRQAIPFNATPKWMGLGRAPDNSRRSAVSLSCHSVLVVFRPYQTVERSNGTKQQRHRKNKCQEQGDEKWINAHTQRWNSHTPGQKTPPAKRNCERQPALCAVIWFGTGIISVIQGLQIHHRYRKQAYKPAKPRQPA